MLRGLLRVVGPGLLFGALIRIASCQEASPKRNADGIEQYEEPFFSGRTFAPTPKTPRKADLFGDPLPFGATIRLGTNRFRHAWPIGVLTALPDGKRVVTACEYAEGILRQCDL